MSTPDPRQPAGDRELRSAWEEHAAEWLAWTRTPGHDHWFWQFNLPALLSLVPTPGHLTVDLGCGEGRFARKLQARGHRVLGIDASPTLARAAATHPQSVPVVLADAARLPLEGGSADLVTACLSLQDFEDLDGAVAEVARALEPAGAFCFAVPHPLATAGEMLDDGTFTFVRDYFASARTSEALQRDGLRMTFESNRHSLTRYATALERAGLVMEALLEPVPSPEWIADHPRVARWKRLPSMLHVRAGRPGRPGRGSARGRH